MIVAHARAEGQNIAVMLRPGEALPEATFWIDLLHPEEAERAFVSQMLGLDLPTKQKMTEIEASSRLHANAKAAFLTSDILCGAETPDPEVGALTIIVMERHLITMRFCEPHALSTFAQRLQAQPELFATLEDGLLALLDTIVDRMADVLELVGRRVDSLSRLIFHNSESVVHSEPTQKRCKNDRMPPRRKEKHLQDILLGIGRAGDINHKLRDTVNSMIRLVTFLGPLLTNRLSADQVTKLRALDHDVRSLSEHAQFTAHETSFLLDATLGQINIEQNAIIKIFSVVAVVFMPPTLFASIWGMNFHYIPELSLPEGYYIALGVMLISAILPLAFFKNRGWL